MEIRRRISIMPESPGMYLRMSVAENLECFADLYEAPVTSLIAYNVIHATFGLALGLTAALLILDELGWRITSATFDREHLITSTR